jgi:hypothetical protein
METRSGSGRSPTTPPLGVCPRHQRRRRFAPQSRRRASFCCKTRRDLRENGGFAPRIEIFSAHPAITSIATPGRTMLSNRPLPKYPNAKLNNPRACRVSSSAGAHRWCETTDCEHGPPDRSGSSSEICHPVEREGAILRWRQKIIWPLETLTTCRGVNLAPFLSPLLGHSSLVIWISSVGHPSCQKAKHLGHFPPVVTSPCQRYNCGFGSLSKRPAGTISRPISGASGFIGSRSRSNAH